MAEQGAGSYLAQREGWWRSGRGETYLRRRVLAGAGRQEWRRVGGWAIAGAAAWRIMSLWAAHSGLTLYLKRGAVGVGQTVACMERTVAKKPARSPWGVVRGRSGGVGGVVGGVGCITFVWTGSVRRASLRRGGR